MSDYTRLPLEEAESKIARPTIAANNFEIKPNLIQMIQQLTLFEVFHNEDSNAHTANFLVICDTFKSTEPQIMQLDFDYFCFR